MRVVMFYHSLVSDWNHGNAHFLRGVVGEMLGRGIDVTVYEPADAWSVRNLLNEKGERSLADFYDAYPELDSTRYDLKTLDINRALDGADIAIVHEWNDPALVGKIGRHHERFGGYTLFFHDTHHRAVTAPDEVENFDLSAYDGVLAFGKVIKDVYLKKGWAKQAWTWHEAADTRVFFPHERDAGKPVYDLIWIGNWGDDERTAELHEFLIEPVRSLGLRAKIYGVRYPSAAIADLQRADIEYGGWIPNFDVPQAFAQADVTVHVPRRPYTEKLPGIPTIRPFEALACGIPLISAPWTDAEHLFEPGKDFLIAHDGNDMVNKIAMVLKDETVRPTLVENGLKAIRTRHTCGHRVDELLQTHSELKKTKLEKVQMA